MRKSNCPESKMSDATITNADHLVSEAKGWSAQLLARVHYGPGDTVEAAMYRAEQKYGVPAYAFWQLRYRKPKDILVSVYMGLKAAYEAECGRQEARLRHELELVKALPSTPARAALVAAGFFLPWFHVIVETDALREWAVQAGAPADLKFGNGIELSLHGADLGHGLGWAVLVLGLAPALLPLVWPADRSHAGGLRGLTLGALGVGTVVMLYIMSLGLTAASAGLDIVVAGYGILWAGELRESVQRAPRRLAVLA